MITLLYLINNETTEDILKNPTRAHMLAHSEGVEACCTNFSYNCTRRMHTEKYNPWSPGIAHVYGGWDIHGTATDFGVPAGRDPAFAIWAVTQATNQNLLAVFDFGDSQHILLFWDFRIAGTGVCHIRTLDGIPMSCSEHIEWEASKVEEIKNPEEQKGEKKIEEDISIL